MWRPIKFNKTNDNVENVYGDVRSGYDFQNGHNLSQCDDSITFKNIDGDVDKGDVSIGYGSIKIHNYLQHNGLE